MCSKFNVRRAAAHYSLLPCQYYYSVFVPQQCAGGQCRKSAVMQEKNYVANRAEITSTRSRQPGRHASASLLLSGNMDSTDHVDLPLCCVSALCFCLSPLHSKFYVVFIANGSNQEADVTRWLLAMLPLLILVDVVYIDV